MLVWKINDWEMVRNCCLFIQSKEWESSRSEGNGAWRLVTTKSSIIIAAKRPHPVHSQHCWCCPRSMAWQNTACDSLVLIGSGCNKVLFALH